MALPTYSTGTVSIANGATTIVGVGTIWSGVNVRAGDKIYVDSGAAVEIKDITDLTHLTLWSPWTQGTKATVTYIIVQEYPARVVGVAAAEDVADMLSALTQKGLPIILVEAGGLPDPSLGADNQYAEDPTTRELWKKNAGVWVSLGTFASTTTADRSGTAGAATAGLQADINNLIAAGGGVLRLPRGIYDCSGTQIVVDLSAITTRVQDRIIIEGEGTGTIIRNTSGSCFKFLGRTSNPEAYFELRDIRFLGNNAPTSTGVELNKAAFATLRNVTIEAFGIGLDATDVDQIGIYDSEIRFNVGGVRINAAVSVTDGNSWTFVNSCVGQNSVYGLQITNANAFTYIGGTIQYNGVIGGGSGQYGILMSDTGVRGYGTALFSGMAFEGNGGAGDFLSQQVTALTGTHCNFTFDTVSFLRTLNFVTVGYGTNQVSISGTQPDANYKFINCNFLGLSGYTASAGRPAIANTNTNATIEIDGLTKFWSNTEAPTTSALYTGYPGSRTGSVTFGGATSGATELAGPAIGSGKMTLQAGTDTLMARATTDSVSNKTLGNTNTVTLKDTLFTLQDDGDTTKQARFQLSGITTGTLRTYAVPDANTTLIGADTTKTLTNTTFDSAGTGNVFKVNGNTITNFMGSGAVVALQANPVFTGSGIIPSWAGGSAANSTLILASTTSGAPSGDSVQVIGSTINLAGALTTISANTAAVVTETGGILKVVNADGLDAVIQLDSFGTGNIAYSQFIFRRAAGTAAAPTQTQSGTILGLFGAKGYTNSAAYTAQRGQIRFTATENQTSSAQGQKVGILTTPNGTTASAVTAEFFASGGCGLGGAADPGAGHLAVNGAIMPKSYTVATLPSGSAGMTVFCSNCRMFNGAGTQEGAGAGTGGNVSYNGSAWKIVGTNVTAIA